MPKYERQIQASVFVAVIITFTAFSMVKKKHNNSRNTERNVFCYLALSWKFFSVVVVVGEKKLKCVAFSHKTTVISFARIVSRFVR